MSIQDMLVQHIHTEEIPEEKQPYVAIKIFPDHWRIVKLGDVLREVDIRAEELKIVESEHIPVLSLTKNKGMPYQILCNGT